MCTNERSHLCVVGEYKDQDYHGTYTCTYHGTMWYVHVYQVRYRYVIADSSQ
jgi:hypothetical protein